MAVENNTSGLTQQKTDETKTSVNITREDFYPRFLDGLSTKRSVSRETLEDPSSPYYHMGPKSRR